MASRRVVLIADVRLADPGFFGPLLGALSEAGAIAELVSEGTAALSDLAGEAPDLVVVDLDAPSLGGVDALLNLKRLASRVPVLILSAEDTRARRMWAVEVGVIGYVTKPVDGEFLAQYISKVLRPLGSGRPGY